MGPSIKDVHKNVTQIDPFPLSAFVLIKSHPLSPHANINCGQSNMFRSQEYHQAVAEICHSLCLAPVNPDWFHQNGSGFLVPAYPGCPGKKAAKWM